MRWNCELCVDVGLRVVGLLVAVAIAVYLFGDKSLTKDNDIITRSIVASIGSSTPLLLKC